MSASYLRGAFIAYEPDGYPDKKRTLPFRFNPEGLSRQLSIEQGQNNQGAGGAGASSGGGGDSEQSADASAGTLKEGFDVVVRFDSADRDEAASNLPPELGVAPEIAALEELMYPAEAEGDASSDGSEPVDARPRRPTVLFVWGRKRVYPVRITGMTINESLYNTELNPIRAEIEVSLEVLGDREIRDNQAVQSAIDFTGSNRRELAKMFLDNTADQSSNILPL